MGATQAQTFLSLFIIKSIIKIETRGNGKIRNLYTCTSVNVLDYALNLSISVEVSRKKLVKRSFILNIYLIRSSKSIIGLWSMYIYLSVFCLLNMHCSALCRSIFRSKVFNEQWTSICNRSNLKIIQSNRISFNPNSLTVSITELEELCQATLIPLSSNKSMKHQSKCIPFSST